VSVKQYEMVVVPDYQTPVPKHHIWNGEITY